MINSTFCLTFLLKIKKKSKSWLKQKVNKKVMSMWKVYSFCLQSKWGKNLEPRWLNVTYKNNISRRHKPTLIMSTKILITNLQDIDIWKNQTTY